MNTNTFGQPGTLIGMSACYALGTFTDNFYKQAAILLAAASQMTSMQSLATLLFSLPYILFSAWAGWLADRAPKKYIVVAAKSIELAALLAGAHMLVTVNWPGILAVITIMGTQAAVFGPAINGSIPEHFPAGRVPRANSLIKLSSTCAILAGMALAGLFLDLRFAPLREWLPAFGLTGAGAGAAADGPALGRLTAAAFIIVVAFAGVITAFTLTKKTPAAQKSPFPLSGPLDSVRHALACRKDPELFLVLTAEAWFYGIAALAVISVANLSASLDYGNTTAGIMSAALTLGVAGGAIIGGRGPAEGWRRLLVPAAGAMGVMFLATALTPLVPAHSPFAGLNPQQCWCFVTLLLSGVCGGVYLIPLASFIQIRPAAHEKGKIQGVSNFMCFMSMALFGALFKFIGLLPPALTFVCYGLATLAFALFYAGGRLRSLRGGSMRDVAASPPGTLLRLLLSLRYRVRERGLEALPAPTPGGLGVLFLPNHPALVDPLIVYSLIAGLRPRPLADARQMAGPLGRFASRVVRAVIIPDPYKDGKKAADAVMAGIAEIAAALRRGDNVLLYPAGRIYRSGRERLGANSAVARLLADLPGLRVVAVRTSGLWGSSFSRAVGAPNFALRLARGAAVLLANLVFFTPRREVEVEFAEPSDLPRDGDKTRLNAYLENFYSAAERPATSVPLWFPLGSAPRILPEPEYASPGRVLEAVDDEQREAVYAILREHAELPANAPLGPEMSLSADLHLDSLALMELGLSLEAEFGCSVPNLEKLITVGDCLAAVSGLLADDGDERPRPAPGAWLALNEENERSLALPGGAARVPDAFLRLVREAPGRPLFADRSRVISRRNALIAVLALSRRLRVLPGAGPDAGPGERLGARLGIMLPAVPAAPLVWIAALLAGREPVLLNWTAGPRSLRHCVELAGVAHVVSASALLDQLERTGNGAAGLPVTWIKADAVFAGLSRFEKLCAAARAFAHCLGPAAVSTARVPEIAAVLFTSGSETAPKAVPLTHANLMANAGDLVQVLGLSRRDRLLAMLPPFHSFGLLANMVLPCTCGLPAAFHPNPTESAPLVSLVRDFKLTLLGATPTFLEAMLRRARGTADLDSLRYAFVGAEKCPEHVYRAFAECCPQAALCEGYGITECSPVVAVNRPGDARPGSIGHALPSVEVAVVREDEEGRPARVPDLRPGEESAGGLLLVRGPSVFGGYIGQAPDPFVEFEGRRWYGTGDLVARDEEGRLWFKGRVKRFVKMGGEMISLPQMEEALQEFFAAGGAPDDGKPHVAVEVRPGSEEAGQAEIWAFTTFETDTRALNAALRAAGMAPVCAVRRVAHLAEIPLLGSGKTDYRALKEIAGQRAG